MSLYLTGGVAVAYAAGVVTVHRVDRRPPPRHRAGLPHAALARLGLAAAGRAAARASRAARALPRAASREDLRPGCWPAPRAARWSCWSALVKGDPVQLEAFGEAAFSGGEARWLGLLSRIREEPRRVLEELEVTPANTPAEAYLREWLAFEHDGDAPQPRADDLRGQAADQPLAAPLRRPGGALLHPRPGQLAGRLHPGGRSMTSPAPSTSPGRHPFYLQAVTQMPFVEEVRPALVRACQEALERVQHDDPAGV